MAGGMLSGANNSGHAEGTTKAGVSEGALLIRDQDGQQQDVTTLNRDTDHANDGSISPIFNREKEQNRLRQAQLIGEIAGQAMDVIRTQGDIAGLKAQTDPAALAQAREQLKKDDKPFRESDVLQRAYNNAMQQYGTGSDLQKAAQAVTGALTALAGNNLAGALASGASPYLATEIKKLTTNPLTGKVDVTSNAMAHAVLGAVTAQLNNQSAVAGGLGAGGGELAARYIAGQLFPGKTADQLSESEKQQVSALSQLAAGLAGGVASGDTGGAVAAAQAGKNAVENNSLSGDKSRETVKQVAESLKNQVRDKLGEGTTSAIANGIINALADTGDATLGSVDYVADAAMALASCASGDSYCNQALSDLSGKNQAVADSVKALMKSETWSTIASTLTGAWDGNQAALEATGGLIAGIILPGKKLPAAEKLSVGLQLQTEKKIGDLATQFNNPSVHPKDFQLNINGKTMVADPELSLGAPVFKGATDADVMTYFQQLAGSESMPSAKVIPGKGTVYSVKVTEGPSAGSTLTLRDFSTSAQQTGAKWTIDIITPSINGGRRVEVKFK